VSVEVVVAVHPPFAWLVDWQRLAASGSHWFLVTTDESKERLAAEGRLDGFAGVATSSAFDVATLGRVIEPWLRGASSRAGVRIATMIEPMQLPLAQLRHALGVPGPTPSQILPFTDKLAMKAAMRGVDALLPRYLPHQHGAFLADPRGYVARVTAQLGPVVFAKPIAENSSIGTARLGDHAELIAFLDSSPYALELDEFVEGEGYHLDSVIVNGRVSWFGAGRYAAPQGQTLDGAPLAGISVDRTDPLYDEVEDLNRTLLGSFPRVPDGCTHMEVLRRADGRWVFLEVAARVPGVRCPEMHRISRGIDLRAVHYLIQADLPVDLTGVPGPHAAYYCPMKTEPGTIASTRAPDFESPYTVEWNRSWLSRPDVARTMSQADCLGYFVLWNEDRSALERDLARTEGFRAYEISAVPRG
jgi:hypothetical protein